MIKKSVQYNNKNVLLIQIKPMIIRLPSRQSQDSASEPNNWLTLYKKYKLVRFFSKTKSSSYVNADFMYLTLDILWQYKLLMIHAFILFDGMFAFQTKVCVEF